MERQAPEWAPIPRPSRPRLVLPQWVEEDGTGTPGGSELDLPSCADASLGLSEPPKEGRWKRILVLAYLPSSPGIPKVHPLCRDVLGARSGPKQTAPLPWEPQHRERPGHILPREACLVAFSPFFSHLFTVKIFLHIRLKAYPLLEIRNKALFTMCPYEKGRKSLSLLIY